MTYARGIFHLPTMKNSEGQQHITNLLLKGINADIDKELLPPDHSTVRDAYLMRKTIRGTYERAPGDVTFHSRTAEPLEVCVGLYHWQTEGYTIEFWYNVSTFVKTIYIGSWKVAEHADLPGTRVALVDVAIDEDDGIMYVTDGAVAPTWPCRPWQRPAIRCSCAATDGPRWPAGRASRARVPPWPTLSANPSGTPAMSPTS